MSHLLLETKINYEILGFKLKFSLNDLFQHESRLKEMSGIIDEAVTIEYKKIDEDDYGETDYLDFDELKSLSDKNADLYINEGYIIDSISFNNHDNFELVEKHLFLLSKLTSKEYVAILSYTDEVCDEYSVNQREIMCTDLSLKGLNHTYYLYGGTNPTGGYKDDLSPVNDEDIKEDDPWYRDKVIVELDKFDLEIELSTSYNGNIVKKKSDGLEKIFHDNGKLKSEDNWLNGKREGLAKGWYDNGQLFFECNWKNDKAHGLSQDWYDNGNKKSEHDHINGELNGKYLSWDINGNLHESYWEKGKELFKPNILPSFMKNIKIYDKGDVVKNPDSEESIDLSPIELSVYDCLMGLYMQMQSFGMREDIIISINSAKEWFKSTNPKAYKVLLE